MNLVQMGLTREVGRLLRLQEYGPEHDDFFRGFVAAGNQPQIQDVLDQLLKVDPQQRLVWSMIQNIFAMSDADPTAAPHARRAAFYGIAGANLSDLALLPSAISSIDPILQYDQDYLTSHASYLTDLLKKQSTADFAEALYHGTTTQGGAMSSQDSVDRQALGDIARQTLGNPQNGLDGLFALNAVANDPNAVGSWDQFSSRWDQLQADPGYQALNMAQMWTDTYDLFKENPVLRQFLADQLTMQNGSPSNAEEIFASLGRNPDQYEKLIDSLALTTQSVGQKSSDIEQLMGVLERALRQGN